MKVKIRIPEIEIEVDTKNLAELVRILKVLKENSVLEKVKLI